MNTTLAVNLWTGLAGSRLYQAVIVVAATVLLAVSARVQVPFWPVPMTMQTFVVLMIGASLGARLAGITMLAYLIEGAVGLPVFASGAGLAYLAGPTGGYLCGFLVATICVGRLADMGFGRSLLSTLAAFVAGEIIIFALGAGWLATIVGFDKALSGGLLPFLPGEAVKVALACAVLPTVWRVAHR